VVKGRDGPLEKLHDRRVLVQVFGGAAFLRYGHGLYKQLRPDACARGRVDMVKKRYLALEMVHEPPMHIQVFRRFPYIHHYKLFRRLRPDTYPRFGFRLVKGFRHALESVLDFWLFI